MMEIRSGTDVARPAEEVFAYVADMANNPKWQQGMKSCRWTSEPPLRLGSTYDQVATFMGKEIITSFEVAELDAGRKIVIESRKSSFPLHITRTVEPLSEGRSRVEAIVRGDPTGFFRVAMPLMRIMVQRSVNQDYKRLRALLEKPAS